MVICPPIPRCECCYQAAEKLNVCAYCGSLKCDACLSLEEIAADMCSRCLAECHRESGAAMVSLNAEAS
jgi:hypothetical protein